MDPARPPGGWYADPNSPGLRYWDGQRWTEHVRDGHGHIVKPRVRARSGRARALAAILGAVMVYLAVYWFRVGVDEGWEDGSFALVGYCAAGLFVVGAFVCLRVALGRS